LAANVEGILDVGSGPSMHAARAVILSPFAALRMTAAALVLLTLSALHPTTTAAQAKPEPTRSQAKPGSVGSQARPDSAGTRVASDSTAAPLAGRVRGSATAPVTVYEMSDFQCPYCRTFALQSFPVLDSTYVATGKVRWAFVNFPLTSIHDNALAAAEVGVCAAQQNAFWRVHDLLYRHQDIWAPLKEPGAFFLSLADSAKISRQALLACVRAPATQETVRAEAQGAQHAGANSTPTFYIEGGLLTGAQPLVVFQQVLDSILRVKTKGKAR
jgi:protein-disulfide isomerase